MKTTFLFLCISLCISLILPFSSTFADNFSEVKTRVNDVQGNSPSATPNAPSGGDTKGFIGEIISRIFGPDGRIQSIFVVALQNTLGIPNNNIPKWNTGIGTFELGSIYDVDGKIGIGTDNPNSALDVYGDIIANDFKKRNGTSLGGKFVDGTDINDAVYMDGNVGIGTTSPVKKLHVVGEVKLDGKVQVGNSDSFPGWSSRVPFHVTFLSSAPYHAVGNIKLGGSDAAVINRDPNGYAGLVLATRRDYWNNVMHSIRIAAIKHPGNVFSSNITFSATREYDNALYERMRIEGDSGNVGIGTTAPSNKLEVAGDVKATAFLYSSDRTLKKDIKTVENSIELISKLEGVSFTWKDTGEQSLGFIAQDVEKVFPELVVTAQRTDANGDSIDGLKSVKYANIVAPLVEATKQQQEMILSLEDRLQAQEEELELLKQLLLEYKQN